MKSHFKYLNLTIVFLLIILSTFSQSVVIESKDTLSLGKESNYYQLQNTMSNNVQQSRYNLTGFEERAIQKLEDFAGYVEIISNKKYDIKLREYVLSLAMKLFYDENIKIENSDKQLSAISALELNDYLNTIIKNGYAKISVEISEQNYVEILTQSKSDSYSGKLTFKQTNNYYKNKAEQKEIIENKEVDIILIRADKNFGKRTMPVWNVFLGEIRVVNE